MRNEIKLGICLIVACEEEEKRMLRTGILRGQTICHAQISMDAENSPAIPDVYECVSPAIPDLYELD